MKIRADLAFLLNVILLIFKVSGEETRQFPKNLKFGVSTSAYQIEGAVNEDGRTESIWDRTFHGHTCFISPYCDNGDIACDSYHNIDRDVEMLRELGVDHYRFSISWNRILPSGFANKINKLGVDHYNEMIDKLLKYNIEPIVTIYHWDLPQILQDLGGWNNPSISEWLGDYARVLFENFGDRVKTWVTINEPMQICFYGYESGAYAPALNTSGIGVYMCSRNSLLAHAEVWHIYDNEFRESQKGQIGISTEAELFVPLSKDDTEAAQLFNYFFWDMYMYPIFSQQGDFPAMVKEKIAAKSFSQGFPRSRLPEFSSEEIAYLKGTSDFFGINHYSTYYVYRNPSASPDPSWKDDVEAKNFQPDDWSNFDGERIKIVPWGLYEILKRVREDYNNPPIFITENGYSYNTKGLNDTLRVKYYHEYLNAMLDAIEEGSNIIGYLAWSLMDNLEWGKGYKPRFGLYEVDYESPARTRTARASAEFYKQVISTRSLSRNLTSWESPSIKQNQEEAFSGQQVNVSI